jgi:UDP-N-acetylmuramoylalanine--D-glutamate ligase
MPHRCELVLEQDGRTLDQRLEGDQPGCDGVRRSAVSAPHRRLLLIAGGRDKDSDFRSLRDAVGAHCDHVLLIGEAAEAMAAALAEGTAAIEVAGDLASAIGRAAALATPGTTVLLSPACASFDQFVSYGSR